MGTRRQAGDDVLGVSATTFPPYRLSPAMNLFDLTGEVAVVIGGTGVLGGALAEGLAAAGAAVAIVGRNAERGEARAEAIRRAGGKALFAAADAGVRALDAPYDGPAGDMEAVAREAHAARRDGFAGKFARDLDEAREIARVFAAR